MSRAVRLAPLVLVLMLLGIFVWRLANPPAASVASRLVGKPVPQFALPEALPGKPALASADLATGQPRLLNIFASWCVPCIAEAPLLAELQRRGSSIDGIAIRDRPEDVKAFLARHGDPFDRIGGDDNSQVQLALGSSGVPETFVIDGRGIIRYHHVGPVVAADVPRLLAELDQAR
jgi:cytochrome c biogenesis protein CcmG/thiol:disulfide interchange protein DsbE